MSDALASMAAFLHDLAAFEIGCVLGYVVIAVGILGYSPKRDR